MSTDTTHQGRPEDAAARASFWEDAHHGKDVDSVSWWQSVPELSLDLDMGRSYAVWHDRAVFHFLTEEDERDDYRASLDRHVEPGGWVVVATFGPDGPTTCSGLPIVRYGHDALAAEFPGYELVGTAGDEHETPWGTVQQFTAVLLRRSA